jgi:hypothetical protein
VTSWPESIAISRSETQPAIVVEAAGFDPTSVRGEPRVVIAVGAPADGAPEADVLLTDEPGPPAPWVQGEAGPVVAAVERNPGAAMVLAQTLRAGAARGSDGPPPDLEAGLVLESMAYGLLQGGPEFAGWLGERTAPPHRPSSEPVRLERDGGVLTITLDRPDVHNAYDAATRDALIGALELVALDDTIAEAHLRGAGPSFCSGGDLSEFGLLPDPVTAHRVRMERSAARAAARVADRLTVHLHGACAGAGIELPAFAGRVTVRPDARIRLPELAMGLIPGAGGTVSLPRRIGRQRTAWLALTGAAIDAGTAVAWGLADELRPAGR